VGCDVWGETGVEDDPARWGADAAAVREQTSGRGFLIPFRGPRAGLPLGFRGGAKGAVHSEAKNQKRSRFNSSHFPFTAPFHWKESPQPDIGMLEIDAPLPPANDVPNGIAPAPLFSAPIAIAIPMTVRWCR